MIPQIIIKLGEKITYGFGFGLGMGLSYKVVLNRVKINEK